MTLDIRLPRFVTAKRLSTGNTAFYWEPPSYWRRRGCPYESVPLGAGLSQAALDAAATPLNDRFNGWRQEQEDGIGSAGFAVPGTVLWLFREYQKTTAFQNTVSEISRPDYRRLFERIAALPTTKGPIANFGGLTIMSVTPLAADKVYRRLSEDDKLRRAEKGVMYCRKAWRIMRRLYPDYFPKDVPNPWKDMALTSRNPLAKAAVDRETVYAFANGVVDRRPELAAVAVICFEFLQRPMNVQMHMVWSDYRPGESIRILHHKTGKEVLHPLTDDDGTLFYPDAEDILRKLPKRGLSMILGPQGQHYKANRFAQLVRSAADDLGLSAEFTMDACRHGGMTELEEAEMTEGQGMALSGHKTPRVFHGYPKRTRKRMLAATRRRIAYRKAG